MIIFLAIIIGVPCWIYYHYHRKHIKQFLSIAPADMTGWDHINLKLSALSKLDDKSVGFIARDAQHHTFFPQYSNDKRFYLINVSFDPKIVQHIETKGHAGSALVGGLTFGAVGAVIGASRKTTSEVKTEEKSATCYLTLVSDDLKQSLTLEALCKTDYAHILQRDYLLNDVELQQIQDKASGAENDVKQAENDNLSIEDRLARLKSLLDKKLITQSDYEDKKKQILGL